VKGSFGVGFMTKGFCTMDNCQAILGRPGKSWDFGNLNLVFKPFQLMGRL